MRGHTFRAPSASSRPVERFIHLSCMCTPRVSKSSSRGYITTSLRITRSLIQMDLALGSAAIIFVSAIFVRSTFKYGDRGYRFVLLEAGHLAQNAILTAAELGLAAAPIGGYMDREVDDYLDIDGLNESTIYIMLIGQPETDTSKEQGT